MGGVERKTLCLNTSVYVHNILLIIKGVAYICYVVSQFFVSVPQEGIVGGFGQERNRWAEPGYLPLGLIPVSILIFGIVSLIFGIIGIITTAKKTDPAAIGNAVLLMVLLMMEMALYTLLGMAGILNATHWLLWSGAAATFLTLTTFCLTLAWAVHIKRHLKKGEKEEIQWSGQKQEKI